MRFPNLRSTSRIEETWCVCTKTKLPKQSYFERFRRYRIGIEGIDGRLFPKLRLNPEGILVTNKVTNVEIPIPNIVTLDFVSSYKLRKILCTNCFNNIELVHNDMKVAYSQGRKSD